jgi:hypothetical protein
MRAHARGGSMLVVPTGSADWKESIVRPISYGVTPPFAELGWLLRDGNGEPSDRRRQEALRQADANLEPQNCTAWFHDG